MEFRFFLVGFPFLGDRTTILCSTGGEDTNRDTDSGHALVREFL